MVYEEEKKGRGRDGRREGGQAEGRRQTASWCSGCHVTGDLGQLLASTAMVLVTGHSPILSPPLHSQ